MKKTFTFTFILLSLAILSPAFALEQKGELDLGNLYNGFNAGIYDVETRIIASQGQSTSNVTTRVYNDDGYWHCSSTVGFEVGKMVFKISSKDLSWQKTVSRKLFARGVNTVEGQDCDTAPEQFVGPQTLYMRVSLGEGFVLPVKPYEGYDRIQAYLAPFRGFLQLPAYIELKNGELSVNLQELMNESNVLGLNASKIRSLQYYVTAEKRNTALSLANGIVEL